MYYPVSKIGKAYRQAHPNLDLVEFLIQTYEANKELFVVVINFDLENETIDFELRHANKDTLNKCCLVNFGGPNKTRYFVTDGKKKGGKNQLKFLVRESIPELYERLKDWNTQDNSEQLSIPSVYEKTRSNIEQLKNLLYKVTKKFFISFDMERRYRFLLDFRKISYPTENYFDDKWLQPESSRKKKVPEGEIDNSLKNYAEEIAKALREVIVDNTELTKQSEIWGYTMAVNGRLLGEDEQYRQFAQEVKIEERYENAKEELCQICNEKKKVSYKPLKETRNLKYFSSQKVIFSWDLIDNFSKRFQICRECFKDLLAAEQYLNENLQGWQVGLNYFAIPTFREEEFPNRYLQRLIKLSSPITEGKLNNQSQQIGNLEDNIQKLSKRNIDCNLNLLFYQVQQKGRKVRKIISDIPAERINNLLELQIEINTHFKDIFDRDYSLLLIDFNTLCYLFPVQKNKNSGGWSKVLDLYESVFTNRNISKRLVIKNILRLLRLIRYKRTKDFYLPSWMDQHDRFWKGWQGNLALEFAVFICVKEICFFKKLGIWKGENKNMDFTNLDLKEDEKAFIAELDYNEQELSLFALGMLVGELGRAQFRDEKKNKPILNAISFQGMPKERIQRFSLDLYQRLRQYDKKYNTINPSSEKWYYLFNKLFSKNRQNWNIDNYTAVFHIMTGYSFYTYRVLTAKGAQKTQEENNVYQEQQ